jgi:hypothetical protein
MPDVRLRLRYRTPVVPYMLVLARYLTVVTPVAPVDVYYHRFHYFCSPPTITLFMSVSLAVFRAGKS